MNSNEEKIRTAVAEQAGEWFVANDAGPLNAQDAAALASWLQTSPVHIEEFLGVSAIARDFKQARTDPEYSLEAILARAKVKEDTAIKSLWSRIGSTIRIQPSRPWSRAAVTMAGFVALTVGVLLMWNFGRIQRPPASENIAELHFQTRHGEQLTQRLADNSVLHLNTDSAVSVHYSSSERLVILRSGQAEFEVAHEAQRAFRVRAGSAEVTDLGTKFDVHLEQGSTVVTVVEGRVAVGNMNSDQNRSPHSIEINANQQIRVAEGQWPATPATVDAESATAWLHHQIVFDHEPLERVAAEYNRYTATPIEIATPALRSLKISGIFATDDPEAFLAFLRSLKGVRVEVTEANIRVSGE